LLDISDHELPTLNDSNKVDKLNEPKLQEPNATKVLTKNTKNKK